MRTFINAATVLTIAIAAVASSAPADVMDYQGQGLKASVKLHADGLLGDEKTIYAGQMKVKWADTNYLGYCVDLDGYANDDSATALPISSLNNYGLVAYLFETYADGVSTGTAAAALQSAIWEVVYETGSTFNVDGGYFSITNNTAVAAAANDLLASLPGSYAPTTMLYVLQPDHYSNQDILIGTGEPVSVPEPTTMALLGLGGVGMLIRRKR